MSAEFVRGRISKCRLYPFKSASPMEIERDGVFTPDIQEVRLTKSGLETKEGIIDHGFMFVSAETHNGVYRKISQRDKRGDKDRAQGLADLVHIRPQFMHGNLYLTWDYQDAIVVPLDNYNGIVLPVEVWQEDGIFRAVDQGNELARWISDPSHLNYPTRLVKASFPFDRKARQNYMPNDNKLRFQDGYPGHWFAKEDVDYLNHKTQLLSENTQGKVAYVETVWPQFRPQLLVEGFPPQFIHALLTASIGGLRVQNPKPCGRCPVTAINPQTGQIKDLNPNTVLGTYQVWRDNHGKAVTIFGENLTVLDEGTIREGDEVVEVGRRDPPLKFGAYKDLR